MMKAVQIEENGELLWADYEMPEVGPGEVLLKVRATAVNRADILQSKGLYPVPKGASPIMGLEAAGEIAEIGEGVERWAVGDHVCCLLAGGAYAEYVVCPASLLLPIPEGYSMTEAVALVEVYYTAYLNIFMEGKLKEEETVLIHSAASGVGSAAILLCKALGYRVLATCSSGKISFVEGLGADFVFAREDLGFVDALKAQGHMGQVDVILDLVGGSYLDANINLLAKGGRMVVVGLVGGPKGPLNLSKLLMKRLQIIGSVLRSRSLREKEAITEGMKRDVWPLFSQGKLRPVIDEVFAIEDVQLAFKKMIANETRGKLVLKVS